MIHECIKKILSRYEKKHIILTAILVLIIGCYLLRGPIYQAIYKFEIFEERQSPCGEYTLVIYWQTRSPFLNIEEVFSLRYCYVVLKDKKGKVLAKPSPICSCILIRANLGTNWDYNSNVVYFSEFSYIDLSTYKIYCSE